MIQDQPNWKWDALSRYWWRGDVRIYPADGEFFVSKGRVWLEGAFATFDQAAEAAQRA